MLACVCNSNRALGLFLHRHSASDIQKQRISPSFFLFWAIRFQWNPIYIPFKGFIKSVLILEDCSRKLASSVSTTSRYKAVLSQTPIKTFTGKGKYFAFSLEVINRLKEKQTLSCRSPGWEGMAHHQNGQGLKAQFWAVAERWPCSGSATVWSCKGSAPFSSISAM